MNGICQIESIGVKMPEKRLTTAELLDKIRIPCIRRFGLLTGISKKRYAPSMKTPLPWHWEL